jgi:hypothetical protein
MANKTFWKGGWHLVVQQNPSDAKGRLGVPCPIFVEGTDVRWVADGVYGASGHFVRAVDASQPVLPLPRVGDRTYKVLTQSDPGFAGKFNPGRLEEILNEMGADGWRVVGVTVAERATWFDSPDAGARQELMVVLERTVDEALVLEERRRRGEVLATSPAASSSPTASR